MLLLLLQLLLLCPTRCTRPAICSTFKLVGTGPSEPLTACRLLSAAAAAFTRPAISSTFKLVGTGPSEPLTGMGMPLVAADLHSHLMQAHRELKVGVL
jgi:hypothetical protein